MSVYRTIGPTLVYFVVAMRDQVQDMRDIHGICRLLTTSGNLIGI